MLSTACSKSSEINCSFVSCKEVKIARENYYNGVCNTDNATLNVRTLVIWRHGIDEPRKFLSHINSLRESIKFTMEIEADNRIPFLDVMVYRKENQIITSIYRKPTHTDRYLNFKSNHHPRIKAGVIKSLAHRARTICNSKENLDTELVNLQRVFDMNDYPSSLVNECLTEKKNTQKIDDTEVEKPATLFTPYIRGFSERLEKICRRLNIRSVFSSRRTLRNELVHVKTYRVQPDRIKGVVYTVNCAECESTYIGETKRTLDTRLKEHKRAVITDDRKNGIATHANTEEHSINWSSARVLHREQNWHRRKLLEALKISNTKPNMNLDSGLRLNTLWDTVMATE